MKSFTELKPGDRIYVKRWSVCNDIDEVQVLASAVGNTIICKLEFGRKVIIEPNHYVGHIERIDSRFMKKIKNLFSKTKNSP